MSLLILREYSLGVRLLLLLEIGRSKGLEIDHSQLSPNLTSKSFVRSNSGQVIVADGGLDSATPLYVKQRKGQQPRMDLSENFAGMDIYQK